MKMLLKIFKGPNLLIFPALMQLFQQGKHCILWWSVVKASSKGKKVSVPIAALMLESWVGLGPNNTGEMKYGQLFYLSNLNMYRKITQAGFFFLKKQYC